MFENQGSMKKHIWIIIFILTSKLLVAYISVLNIDVIHTDCFNSGQIKISAKTNRPPLLYQIVENSEIYPIQSSPILKNLKEGVYKIKIFNYYNEAIYRNVTIYSRYTPISIGLNYSFTKNVMDSIATVICNPINGKPPFKIKIISEDSSVNIEKETSSAITEKLHSNNYNITIQDSCGNIATKYQSIYRNDPNAPIRSLKLKEYSILKYTCDIMRLNTLVEFYNFNFLKILYIQDNRIDSMPMRPVTSTFYFTKDLNIDFNKPLTLKFINEFKDTFTHSTYTPNFRFSSIIAYKIGDYCKRSYYKEAIIKANFKNAYNINLKIVDSMNNIKYQKDIYAFDFLDISNFQEFKKYYYFVNDLCGNSFKDSFIIDYRNTINFDTSKPKVDINKIPVHCYDSTASIVVTFNSSYNLSPKFKILSKPRVIKSTRKGYEYQDTNTFNTVIYYTYTNIYNLGVGTYPYYVTNICGDTTYDSFTIHPTDLQPNYNTSLNYEKGCDGKNIVKYKFWFKNQILDYSNYDIFFNKININKTEYTIYKNIDSMLPDSSYVHFFKNDTIALNSFSGSGMNIYKTEFYKNENMNYVSYCKNKSDIIKIDTIFIPEYSRFRVNFNNIIKCGKLNTLEVLLDTNKGIKPFNFEIISGPHLFPIQSSNIFKINDLGDYKLRVVDYCGYSNVYNFSIDSLLFPPLTVDGSLCVGNSSNLSFISSLYFKYKWQKPDNTIFWGDTLPIVILKAKDIGTYNVTKYISMEDCKDTQSTQFEINPYIDSHIYVTICPFTTYSFGTKKASISGVYYDTLRTSSCDSISILHLSVLKVDTSYIKKSICEGFYFEKYNHSGIYLDTLYNGTCPSLRILELNVNPKTYSKEIKIICHKTTYKNYSQEGIYTEKYKNEKGCDSTYTLDLFIKPSFITKRLQSVSGCENDTILISSQDSMLNYHWSTEEYTKSINVYSSGWYKVTLTNIDTCSLVDSCYALFHSNPQVDIGNDTTIYLEELLDIKPSVHKNKGIKHFEWTSNHFRLCKNCFNQSLLVLNPFNMKLRIIDSNNCIGIDSFHILTMPVKEFGIPNSFSPNGDMINDYFELNGGPIRRIDIDIYNRLGEKVYSSQGATFKWDGKYLGEEVPMGIYTYKAVIHIFGLKIKEYKGSISLFR